MTAAEQAHVVSDHHMRVDLISSTPKKVLIVVANPSTSTTMGWPVGFWGAELTHPYYELTERGVAVTIASPDGGKVEMDSLSDPRDPSKWSAEDLVTMDFVHTPELVKLLEDTPKLADLDLDEYDAITVAGGQSPMFTCREKRISRQRSDSSMNRRSRPRSTATAQPRSSTSNSRTGHISSPQDGDGLRQRRGGFQRRVCRPEGNAVARRGRAHRARRGLHPGWTVQGFRGARRPADHRPAAVLGPEVAQMVIEALGV